VRHLTHQVRMVHLTEGTIQYYPDEDSTDTENSMLLKTTGGGSRTWSEAQINTDDLHGEKATGDELSHLQNPDGRVYYQIFFVVMPIFCGYAALFSLQEKVMEAMYGVGAQEPHIFGVACSMLYLGNLFFRLGHNVVFGFLTSRMRVVLSMTSMALSMWTVFSIFVWFRDPSYVWMVFLGYGFGGLAIGTFESNVLSIITPLGKDTKLWAIIAIPVGINVVNIGGFVVLGFWDWLDDNPEAIHMCVLIYTLFGVVVLYATLWDKCQATTSFSIKEFLVAFTFWREWIGIIKWNCVAMMVDMFCVSLFSPGVILYIYSGDCVQFTISGFIMNSFWFVALYNTFFFIGDTLSRKIFYKVRLINPFLFLIFSAVGIFMGLLDVTILVPLTALGVSFANGSLYTQTARLIDKEVPEKFNLVSLSFWLFVGDIGSVTGSNLISYLSTWISDLYNTTPLSSSMC